MITYTDVVIVIKTNNTSTTILNELKLACRAAHSLDKQDIKVNHRIYIESNVIDKTIKLVIDGIQIFTRKIDELPKFQFYKIIRKKRGRLKHGKLSTEFFKRNAFRKKNRIKHFFFDALDNT